MKYKNWIALFSQTGQQIIDISNQIDRIPDLIISNRIDSVLSEYQGKVYSRDIFSEN